MKAKIVERQIKIATEDASSNREATSAARVLVSMETQNIATKDAGPQRLDLSIAEINQMSYSQIRQILADADDAQQEDSDRVAKPGLFKHR